MSHRRHCCDHGFNIAIYNLCDPPATSRLHVFTGSRVNYGVAIARYTDVPPPTSGRRSAPVRSSVRPGSRIATAPEACACQAGLEASPGRVLREGGATGARPTDGSATVGDVSVSLARPVPRRADALWPPAGEHRGGCRLAVRSRLRSGSDSLALQNRSLFGSSVSRSQAVGRQWRARGMYVPGHPRPSDRGSGTVMGQHAHLHCPRTHRPGFAYG
jgi:hypothetical protein